MVVSLALRLSIDGWPKNTGTTRRRKREGGREERGNVIACTFNIYPNVPSHFIDSLEKKGDKNLQTDTELLGRCCEVPTIDILYSAVDETPVSI